MPARSGTRGSNLHLNGTPLKKKNFKWDMTLNWALNRNEVVSLLEGVENLQLGSFQGGITINAQVGQPYGVIYGTDYTYLDGQKVVDPDNGQYIKTANSNHVIGNSNPKWNGGFLNTITYKNWALGFLIDVQMGGDIFSLDMYYGLATGLYEETAFTNDLGNPVRDPIVYNNPDDPSQGYAPTSGGFINEGVNPDGSPNKTRISAANFGAQGYRRGLPDIAFVYDATYVKLRNISLSYSLPSKALKNCFITGITLTALASNIWIIYKAFPYSDPEAGLGAGNLQGFQTGALPATRDFTFNVKLTF